MEEVSGPTRIYYLEERHEAIINALERDSIVHVNELSKHLGVSSATIRKDLCKLEREGRLRRTHGGAIPPRAPGTEERVAIAATSAHAEKVRIGRAAARYVSNGDALFVHSGTTCLEFMKALAGQRGLTLITCDLSIALAAEELLKDSSIILLGGVLRIGYHYTQGPDALRQLQHYYAPTSYLCANAFSFDHGFTAHRREQAEWIDALIRNSERHIMLLDSSKIGESALAHVAGLDALDALITDDSVSESTRERFAQEAPQLEIVYA